MRESLEKDLGISQENSQKIIDFISIKVDNKNIRESMKSVECDNSIYLQGLDELCVVGAGLIAFDVPAENYVIDLSIARGLDYYTGTVYETILVDKKEVGSICSGGRYEDLASHFSDKKFVGVGISIGLSRLLSKLFEMNVLDIAQQTTSKIMIATFPDIDISNYFKIAKNIMQSDMACEVYTEGGKLGNQIKYADRKGIKYVIISGQEEMDKNIITVKDLKNSETFNVEKDKLISFLKERL
jgi:histidyl-tRNA synthetase